MVSQLSKKVAHKLFAYSQTRRPKIIKFQWWQQGGREYFQFLTRKRIEKKYIIQEGK